MTTTNNNPTKTTTPGTTTTDPTKTVTNQGTVVHLPTGGVINDPTKIVTTTNNNPTKTTTPGGTTTDPTKTVTNQGTVVHLPTGGVINDPTKIVTTTQQPDQDDDAGHDHHRSDQDGDEPGHGRASAGGRGYQRPQQDCDVNKYGRHQYVRQDGDIADVDRASAHHRK